ncbi:hypothetical protein HU200_026496 [Digitaria exilis]|uniref:Uncharacterized protein n=1 Tax=Digitaria exilis TaxID=1010633 RepID=A0A835BW34_9POAL|nr:hypothetical protein HU200_026496 [Digitaria exilis]
MFVRIFLSLKLVLINLVSGRLGSICLLYPWQKDEEERRKKE